MDRLLLAGAEELLGRDLRVAEVAQRELVERDGRQLPICAQHAGARIEVAADQRLRLKRSDAGRLSLELQRAT